MSADDARKIPRFVQKILNFTGKVVGEVVGEALFWVLGWSVCVSVLIGVYKLGRFIAANYLGMSDEQDMVGLLSAVTVIWLYERRDSQERYDKLRGRF